MKPERTPNNAAAEKDSYRRSRKEQGLPYSISDPDLVRRLAVLFDTSDGGIEDASI